MRRLLYACAIVMLVALAALLGWRLRPTSDRFYTDADRIKEPAADAPLRDVLWQPSKELAAPLNTEHDDYEPRLSADGMTLYLVRGKAGENADIYVAHRRVEGWSDPEPVAALNSAEDDLGPEPSPDGQSLYFYSNRAGSLGGYDLWVSRRAGDDWSAAINLGSQVNSPYNDYGPALAPDGSLLYFASNRPRPNDDYAPTPGAWPATLREELFYRTYDLYAAPITERGMGVAGAIDEVNTPSNEGSPCLSPWGDFLYFASDRPGGEGGFDLYRSRRLRGEHQPPTNLGKAVNTTANELDPALSLGGYGLHFSSDRVQPASIDQAATTPATADAAPRRPDYNIYYTTSREVFAETEYGQRASIDWSGLWAAVGPNLLWALLALLLLLSLIALYRSARSRRMNLLTKCLLASLAAHLLLMLMLNTWHVAAGVAGEFHRRGGRIQISLAAPARGNGIASQILGGLTEPGPSARPAQSSSARIELRAEPATSAPMANPAIEGRSIEIHDAAYAEVNPSDAQPSVEATVVSLSAAPPLQRPALNLPLPPTEQKFGADERDAQAEAKPAAFLTNQRADTARLVKPAAESINTMLVPESAPRTEPKATSLATLVEPTDRRVEAAGSTIADALPAVGSAFIPSRPSMPVLALPADQPSTAASGSEHVATPATRDIESRRVQAAGPGLGTGSPENIEIAPSAGAGHGIADSRIVSEFQVAEASAGGTSDGEAFGTGLVGSAGPAVQLVATDSGGFGLPTAEPGAMGAATEEATGSGVAAMSAAISKRAAPSGFAAASADVVSLSPEGLSGLSHAGAAAADAVLVAAVSTFANEAPTSGSQLVLGVPTAAPSNIVAAAPQQFRLPGEGEGAPPARAAVSEQAAGFGIAPSGIGTLQAPAGLVGIGPIAEVHAPPGFDRGPGGRVGLGVGDSPLGDTLASASDLAPTTNAVFGFSLRPGIPGLSADSLKLPGLPEEIVPDRPYMQRFGDDRMDSIKKMGGSEETEEAVALALKWLAAHQNADGHWDAKTFDAGCNKCGGQTDVQAENALTGMGLLCFLGAGHTHTRPGPYQNNVRRAVDWLLAHQKEDGDLRGSETMYSHGIASIALSESFAMTGDSRLKDRVSQAVQFIYDARNPADGGWRYDPGQAGDTSVLGWQVMALKSAQMAGVAVPEDAFAVAKDWLDRVSSNKAPGLYSYQPGTTPTASMTAEGMFAQLLLGLDPAEPRQQMSVDFVLQNLPDWKKDPNTYFWYYASLALFQHQGPAWQIWNQAVKRELVENQRRDGRAAGSWNPVGEWAKVGGRVYQTAICTLMLEVYYRYLPLYKTDEAASLSEIPAKVVGVIRGSVRDFLTGDPLPGSVVRLTLPDRDALTAEADGEGGFVMFVPPVPEHFALSATMDGYVPGTLNVERRRLSGHTLAVDFALQKIGRDVLVMEAEPEVHHLGDNHFDGQINSQFQKEAEGDHFDMTFALEAAQLPAGSARGEVVLMAKGVQRRHSLKINGHLLEQRIDHAPEDGSFGELAASFDLAWLQPGDNKLEIVAAPSDSDIDDFEFVNIRVRVVPGNGLGSTVPKEAEHGLN